MKLHFQAISVKLGATTGVINGYFRIYSSDDYQLIGEMRSPDPSCAGFNAENVTVKIDRTRIK